MAASKNLTAVERSLRASLASNRRWAHADRQAESEKARQRELAKAEREVDPDGVLPPEERAKRAENALRARMQAMALKSAKARRLRAEAAALEAEAAEFGGDAA